ncbi:hypothetical protein Dip510_000864 [Elusimicrobium posterum]|uniref:Cof-type HAD-IIB family hydrolase n=1 Tax=Elusimicrobium posterum TaxID=3116653 RepID=UPI003C748818
MIKAIFFDIDGTLLSFKTNKIPQSTIDAFAKLKNDGIKLFIATGRPLIDIKGLDALSFDGFITKNGAYCVDAERNLIYKEAIPREDVEALMNFQKEHPFPCILVTPECNALNYADEAVRDLYSLVKVPVPPATDWREVDPEQVYQITMYVNEQQEAEIMQRVLTGCQSSRWYPTFADVNKRGVSKQSGIDRMLEHHNIKLEETMAFGDGGNDIPMLKHVALGVAMGNAADNVKAVAKYVTDTVDNNGIWNALQKFIWKEQG